MGLHPLGLELKPELRRHVDDHHLFVYLIISTVFVVFIFIEVKMQRTRPGLGPPRGSAPQGDKEVLFHDLPCPRGLQDLGEVCVNCLVKVLHYEQVLELRRDNFPGPTEEANED